MSVSDLNEEKNNIVACIRRSFSRRDILMEYSAMNLETKRSMGRLNKKSINGGEHNYPLSDSDT